MKLAIPPVVLAVVILAGPDRTSAQPEPGPVHPVIEAYHLTLALLLPEEAISRLEMVDPGGTAGAPLSAVVYRVADAAVRRFAPLALDAAGRRTEAMQLRRLPVISDFQSADGAEQALRRLTDSRPAEGRPALSSAALEALLSARMAARQAMHADRPSTPDRVLSGIGDGLLLAEDPSPESDAMGSERADPANPYSPPERTYTVSNTAEASAMAAREVITAAGAAHDALRAGASPVAVIEASIRSLDDIVAFARRYAPPRRIVPPATQGPSTQPEPGSVPEQRPAFPPARTPPPVVPDPPYETSPATPTESTYRRSR